MSSFWVMETPWKKRLTFELLWKHCNRKKMRKAVYLNLIITYLFCAPQKKLMHPCLLEVIKKFSSLQNFFRCNDYVLNLLPLHDRKTNTPEPLLKLENQSTWFRQERFRTRATVNCINEYGRKKFFFNRFSVFITWKVYENTSKVSLQFFCEQLSKQSYRTPALVHRSNFLQVLTSNKRFLQFDWENVFEKNVYYEQSKWLHVIFQNLLKDWHSLEQSSNCFKYSLFKTVAFIKKFPGFDNWVIV